MEPFYMTYPMQNLYQAEMEYEKDLERMREMYPKEVTKILVCIEDRCDELEFEGSRIYDENPDRMMMEREVQALYEKIKKLLEEEETQKQQNEEDRETDSEESKQEEEAEQPEAIEPRRAAMLEAFALNPPEEWLTAQGLEPRPSYDPVPRVLQGSRPPYGRGRGHGRGHEQNGCDGWLCSMVGVLFQNEIYRRRCRHRRCQRWW